MSSFKTIPAGLSALSTEVPDSKVSNSDSMCPPQSSKSSRLMQALLALDEKYASEVKSTSSGTNSDVKLLTVPKLSSLLQARSMSSHLKVGSKPIRVRLVSNFTLTSAAATALTQVQALTPYGASDFSSFAALYDLYRTTAITVYWQCNASGNINGNVTYAIAFDPSNIGAYSSTADVMTAEQHVGPALLQGTGLNASSLPTTVSERHPGYFKFPVKIKTQKVGIRNDSTASNAVGGSWVGTSDTTAVVGWLKPYVPSAGGALTTSLQCYVAYDVEFMART